MLRTLAAQLEATFDGAAEAPTSSPQLLGAWSLVFTDASDVLALGALPATLGDITQTVARAEDGDGGADFVADNAVELEPPSAPLFGAIGALAGLRPATQCSVRARCRVLDEKRLSLLFVGGSVRSSSRSSASAAPPRRRRSPARFCRRRSPRASRSSSTAASSSRRPTSTTRSASRAAPAASCGCCARRTSDV